MFDQFSIYDVMSRVGLDTSRIRSSSGYFDCPICGGKKKLNVNPHIGHGGVCRCAKCAAGGDKLDLFILYAMAPNLVQTPGSKGYYYRPSEVDRKEGMKKIEQELHLLRNTPGYLDSIRKTRRRVEEAAAAKPKIASHEARNAVYTAFLGLLRLTAPHKDALRARGLTDEGIEKCLFRSTPMFGRPQIAQKLMNQGLCLENVPGFFKAQKIDEVTGEVNEEWSIYCPDAGYFVPIRDKDGYIVSMQIRLNKPTTGKDKYRFFSSSKETLEGGIGAVSEVHVEMCSEAPKYVYITEGPIKGHVAHALYKQLYCRDDLIILCVVGTSNFGGVFPVLELMLEKYDIEAVVEFYDLDKYTNQYVERDRGNLEVEIKKTMMKKRDELAKQYEGGKFKPLYVSFPQERYMGKGVDDHLLAIYEKTRRSNNG